MDIKEPIAPKDMGDLFTRNERIVVPPYQRRFSWEEDNFKDVWEDIAGIEPSKQHFFGTIVFMSEPHVAQNINELDVVDGQQRITTVSILLCAIQDYLEDHFPDKDVQDRVERINESLWLVDRDGNKQGMRLVLGNLDKESYRALIKSEFEDIENENIKEAYDYFSQRLEGLSLDEIRDFHDTILDQLIYVSITANGHEDAYQLFEAMNNRGLSLSPIDLMKNYLLMQAASDSEVDEDSIERKWGKVIQNIDDLEELNNPAETFFQQYFMSSDMLNIEGKITTNKLYPTFQDAVDNTEDLGKLLDHIRSQSVLYNNLINQEVDRFSRSDNIEVNILLRDLLEISQVPFTLLLRAFRESDDTNLIKEIIRKSIALMIRRQICDRSTAPNYRIFNHLAQEGFTSEEGILQFMDNYLETEGMFPDDDQFRKYFKEEDFRGNDRTKYILSKIEEELYGKGGKKVSESRYQVHIEHILPSYLSDSLRENWLNPFGISEEEHEELKTKIGNLTLLESDPNIRASNRDLEEKKKYYGPDKTDFEMTHKLKEYDRWGTEEIQERSRELADAAVTVWAL